MTLKTYFIAIAMEWMREKKEIGLGQLRALKKIDLYHRDTEGKIVTDCDLNSQQWT